MTAKNGNGVVLASGKAKGASGVAAVLTMLTTIANATYFADVMRDAAQRCWGDFWEEDWTMDYTVGKPTTRCKIQLSIGAFNYLIIDAHCAGCADTTVSVSAMRMQDKCPQKLGEKPYEFGLCGDCDQDSKMMANIIGILVRTLGVSALDGEPAMNPFDDGVVY